MDRTEREPFQRWALSCAAGFDCTEFGDREARGIWTCGLEWGAEFDSPPWDESVESQWGCHQRWGYEPPDRALGYPYNWNLAKVLAVIEGYDVHEYREFARERRLWLEGGGYAKLNLFPLACRNMRSWPKRYRDWTSFSSKEEYYQWCREARFPWLAGLAGQYRPRLILCTGITYVDQFRRAWIEQEAGYTLEKEDELEIEPYRQKIIVWRVRYSGGEPGIVAVTYFPVGRYGINSYEKARLNGEALRMVLDDIGPD